MIEPKLLESKDCLLKSLALSNQEILMERADMNKEWQIL